MTFSVQCGCSIKWRSCGATNGYITVTSRRCLSLVRKCAQYRQLSPVLAVYWRRSVGSLQSTMHAARPPTRRRVPRHSCCMPGLCAACRSSSTLIPSRWHVSSYKSRCTSNIRSRVFAERVINIWNSLPQTVNYTSLVAFRYSVLFIFPDLSSYTEIVEVWVSYCL